MKKVLALIMIVVLLASFAACGQKTDAPAADAPAADAPAADEPAADEPADEPAADEPAADSGQSADPGRDPVCPKLAGYEFSGRCGGTGL